MVTFGGHNGRNWPLSVDADYWAVILAVRIGVGPCYVEVISDSRCLRCQVQTDNGRRKLDREISMLRLEAAHRMQRAGRNARPNGRDSSVDDPALEVQVGQMEKIRCCRKR